jgi:hypothetical protein
LIIRRLIVPLTVAVLVVHSAPANAQGAFPAPLPGQSAAPAGASPFPPVNGAAAPAFGSAPSSFPAAGAPPVSGGAFSQPQAGPAAGGPPGGDECMKNFTVLRQEAEKRGNAIKAAGQRRAPPDEACKLISSFSQVEVKMVKYVETNSQKCGIPPQIAEQLRNGHKNTEAMQQKVCALAQQQPRGPAGPSLSEVLGSSNAVPEANLNAKRSGGSTFDTLNGNVLSR